MKFSVVFTSSDTLVSWAIRKLTRSRVSHCAVVTEVLGHRCALEADWFGFRCVPMSRLAQENTVEAEFFPDVELSGATDESMSWIGSPYDYAGLFGFLVVLAGRSLGKSWKNPASGPRRVFCSESVVRILQAAGFERALHLDPDMVSPQDLLAFCQETMG